MNCLDYFGVQIKCGDIISFPTSGILEDGKVVELINARKIRVINVSGYKKMKYCKDVVNKTMIVDSLKITNPEEFI